FCVYYSHREDWDHPDGYGNNWDYDRTQKKFERYLDEKSKPQLRELLTNYGPLGLVWFDRGMETPQQAAEFVKLVRSLQPNYLLNIGPMGDGTIPPPSVAVLEQVGTWMGKNAESIYGTSACPLEFPWGRCTAGQGRIYLHVFSSPADGFIRVSGLRNEVKSAY